MCYCRATPIYSYIRYKSYTIMIQRWQGRPEIFIFPHRSPIYHRPGNTRRPRFASREPNVLACLDRYKMCLRWGFFIEYNPHSEDGVDHFNYTTRSIAHSARGCVHGHDSAAHSESYRKEGVFSPPWPDPSTILRKCPIS